MKFPLPTEKYGPTISSLIGAWMPGIVFGEIDRPDASRWKGELDRITPSTHFPHLRDLNRARCCLAGLWLWHDYFTESHQISQNIDTASGSIWHAILHRREPDFGNAKYWYRQIARHPALERIGDATRPLAQAWAAKYREHPHRSIVVELGNPRHRHWNGSLFVDLCEVVILLEPSSQLPPAEANGNPLRSLCQSLACWEWALLFDDDFGV